MSSYFIEIFLYEEVLKPPSPTLPPKVKGV
jgi:hypothetical protein